MVKKIILFVSFILINLFLVNFSFAESTSKSKVLGENEYYNVTISKQLKFIYDKHVELGDCKNSTGSSTYYNFNAAGFPTVVNKLVSIDICSYGEWNAWGPDSCVPYDISTVDLKEVSLSSEFAKIFTSDSYNGLDLCQSKRENFSLKGEYISEKPDTNIYELKSFKDEVKNKLNSFE